MTRLESLSLFIPELIVSATILVLFVADFFAMRFQKKLAGLCTLISVLGLTAALLMSLALSNLEATSFFYGMLAFDRLATFTKILFPLATLLIVIFSNRSREMEKVDLPSYHILVLTLFLGALLLAASTNLLMIYLSLEMVSIASYLLAGSLSGVRRSSEAALKYVIYGGVASGIMLFGFSILYGLSGTLNLHEMYQFFSTHPTSEGVLVLALIFAFAGFAYKIAAVPFHMWAPDVYEGAPIPIAAFFSVVPKAAGIIAMLRFFMTAFAAKDPVPFTEVGLSGWVTVLIILSVATMTLGNLAALFQSNMKRLLAYSSIAHAGYCLMGFAAMNGEALEAILFYLVVYFIMNLGAFLVVLMVYNQMGVESLEGYRGLGQRSGAGTLLGVIMTIFLLSLTGLPPLAGFIGKLVLFGAVIKAGLFWLAIVGVLNSVVSLVYYMRIVKVMFFDPPADDAPFVFERFSHPILAMILAALTLVFGLFWNPLAQWAQSSAGLYF